MTIDETAGKVGGRRSRPLWDAALDAVRCRLGGKHVPRTLERMTDDGKHIKVSVCRKCHCVA
jgi:hypothetical protein